MPFSSPPRPPVESSMGRARGGRPSTLPRAERTSPWGLNGRVSRLATSEVSAAQSRDRRAEDLLVGTGDRAATSRVHPIARRHRLARDEQRLLHAPAAGMRRTGAEAPAPREGQRGGIGRCSCERTRPSRQTAVLLGPLTVRTILACAATEHRANDERSGRVKMKPKVPLQLAALSEAAPREACQALRRGQGQDGYSTETGPQRPNPPIEMVLGRPSRGEAAVVLPAAGTGLNASLNSHHRLE